MPIANGFLKKNSKYKEYFFPLKLSFNNRLSLVQITNNPNPKKMFNKDYPFYTSSSKFMEKHFYDLSNWIKKNYLKKKSYILELGSNDGTFLKNFKKEKSFGFEPSKSVHNLSLKSVNSINKFFNKKILNFLRIKKYLLMLSLVQMFSVHIPDQKNLIKSMDTILSDNGTIIFEEPYLGSMYKKISYDQIYDEHIYMFSLSSIEQNL